MKTKWIILSIVVIVCIAAYFYFRVRKTADFEPQIKAKLTQVISDATNGLYKLELEHIAIDVTNGSVIANNILLFPDSARLLQLEQTGQVIENLYEVSLKRLDLNGLSPMDLIAGKNIQLEMLVLDSPQIRITKRPNKKKEKDTTGLYEKVAGMKQSYRLKELLLNDIRLTVVNLEKSSSVSSTKNISAALRDIQIDSTTKNDTSRFLFAKDAVVFVKGFSQVMEKNRYHFDIDSMALKPLYGTLQFFHLTFKPEGSKEDFSRRLKYQQDRYNILIKSGEVKNLHWFNLLSKDGLMGDEIKLTGGTIDIYHDRSLPLAPPKSDNFPHQMLMKAGLPLSIKKVSFSDLRISYEELNPKSEHVGRVIFNDIQGDITNVTNIATEVKSNGYTVIKASSIFMNAGKLDAMFRLDLANAATGKFSVDATLGQMNGLSLNTMTEGLALIKIKSAEIDGLRAHIDGANKSATGIVTFLYRDLSFDVLKNDDGELKKRGLFSFIANTIIIKKSNPGKPGEVARKYAVVHSHDPTKSFFNLIWKAISQGILKTVK